MATGADVPGRYRYEWALFADWCAAADLAALPASPLTVAVFLAENPAGNVAQRRRVAVVNRVHTVAGYPAPGTVTAIRLQLDRARTGRAAVLRGRLAPIIAALPVAGWPTGMFGRRDAVILALYAAGLRAVDISRLDRRDIAIVGDGVRIGGRHQLHLHPDVDGAGAAVIDYTAVWRRWEQVLRVVQEHPSTRVLEQHLRAGALPDPDDDMPRVSGPVVVPIDRWGAVPLPPTVMTPAAITSVMTNHLAGTPARHRPLPTRPGPARSSAKPSVVPCDDNTGLSDTYAAGVAARSAAHTALADVGDVLDKVEDRAEELLRRTLALLDDL
ncbi:hypothetical protein HQ305_08600 [Rhodococcus sp. BP-149]|uniref:hypothetical protein n=1 Tax=unclassified Rhodococcus (in: high G+C Gram-positive bacteria) TaxID=192944 RepID=UPI001C9BB3DE|nr:MULTISPECIES: hypothetical protein [unclassified Rhodococcus (in: high G+C Gram-positive bacteria)]MBY6686141.1 hypothetical protein [Rhodococcus sp. BP-288]MBY6693769.1 hypothetical protein [Rhodococcus sp. BP-188]MBY6699634.1 hypothetical protein [Rhodococcus sp. BP-285]MBY6704021.1 hypothetical protein [Rhodococcus sp. BP-283]MBY6710830.1 hypothetical protein [Rhodococcus sp. BP-160]